MRAAGQTTETEREGNTPMEAACASLAGWHAGARLTGPGRESVDLYGPATHYTARVGKTMQFADIRVSIVGEN